MVPPLPPLRLPPSALILRSVSGGGSNRSKRGAASRLTPASDTRKSPGKKSTTHTQRKWKQKAPPSHASPTKGMNQMKVKSMPHPTGEDDKYIPAEPAPEFPDGWTRRFIARSTNASNKDKHYYSPKMDYKFRTKAQAKRFVEILGTDPVIDGGEEAAMVLFKLKPKKKRKAAVSVGKHSTTSSTDHITGDIKVGDCKTMVKEKRKKQVLESKELVEEDEESKYAHTEEAKTSNKKPKLTKSENIVSDKEVDDVKEGKNDVPSKERKKNACIDVATSPSPKNPALLCKITTKVSTNIAESPQKNNTTKQSSEMNTDESPSVVENVTSEKPSSTNDTEAYGNVNDTGADRNVTNKIPFGTESQRQKSKRDRQSSNANEKVPDLPTNEKGSAREGIDENTSKKKPSGPKPTKKKSKTKSKGSDASKQVPSNSTSEKFSTKNEVNESETKKTPRAPPTNGTNKSKANKRAHPTGEDDTAEPAPEFPAGWTCRQVPRNKDASHWKTCYYSPKMGYIFRTEARAKRFVEILGIDPEIDGGEEAAMVIFKQRRCTKGKASVSIGKHSTTSSREISMGETDVENCKAMAKVALKGKNKRKKQVIRSSESDEENEESKFALMEQAETSKKKPKVTESESVVSDKVIDWGADDASWANNSHAGEGGQIISGKDKVNSSLNLDKNAPEMTTRIGATEQSNGELKNCRGVSWDEGLAKSLGIAMPTPEMILAERVRSANDAVLANNSSSNAGIGAVSEKGGDEKKQANDGQHDRVDAILRNRKLSLTWRLNAMMKKACSNAKRRQQNLQNNKPTPGNSGQEERKERLETKQRESFLKYPRSMERNMPGRQSSGRIKQLEDSSGGEATEKAGGESPPSSSIHINEQTKRELDYGIKSDKTGSHRKIEQSQAAIRSLEEPRAKAIVSPCGILEPVMSPSASICSTTRRMWAEEAEEKLATLRSAYDSCIDETPFERVGGNGATLTAFAVVQNFMLVLPYAKLHDLDSSKSKERRDIESGLVRVLKSAERMKWVVMNRNNNDASAMETREDGDGDRTVAALADAKLLRTIRVQTWIRMMVWSKKTEIGWEFLRGVIALSGDEPNGPGDADYGERGKKEKMRKKRKEKMQTKQQQQQQRSSDASPRDGLVADIISLLKLVPSLLPRWLNFSLFVKHTLTFGYRQPAPEYSPEIFDYFEIEVSEELIALRKSGTDMSRLSERSEMSRSPAEDGDDYAEGGRSVEELRQRRQHAYFTSLAKENEASNMSSNNSNTGEDESATITGSRSMATSASRASRASRSSQTCEKDDATLFKTSVGLTSAAPNLTSNPFLKGTARRNYVGSHLGNKLTNPAVLFREVRACPRPRPEMEGRNSLSAKRQLLASGLVEVRSAAINLTMAAGPKNRMQSGARTRLLASSPLKETDPSASASSFFVEESPTQKRRRPPSATAGIVKETPPRYSMRPTNLWGNPSGQLPMRRHDRSGDAAGTERLSPVTDHLGASMPSFGHSPMPHLKDLAGAIERRNRAYAVKLNGKKK